MFAPVDVLRFVMSGHPEAMHDTEPSAAVTMNAAAGHACGMQVTEPSANLLNTLPVGHGYSTQLQL